MRVLLVGSGGREHALAWALAASPLCDELICAPGNAGIAEEARCVPVKAEDIPGIVRLAREERIDFVVVGPEAPLVAGLVDALEEAGIAAFGPRKAAAALEGSKGFTKDLCTRKAIPTAAYERFTDAAMAKAYISARGAPIVVKADGLAAGKGVVVAQSVEEAHKAVDAMMTEHVFGAAGNEVVIEDLLVGEEASYFALCDGTHAIPLGAAQDHKRVYDGDRGPNTGGMGAYSPAPVVTPDIARQTMDRIILPALQGLAEAGTPFKGVLFAGLMIGAKGPQLIEFNVRFGDPECQVLVPRLHSDLLAAFVAARDGQLKNFALRWDDRAALCVVMAAQGYPGTVRAGTKIHGVEDAKAVDDVLVFHAGTRREGDALVAAGGRVLGITALGATVAEAQARAYRAVDSIDWPEGFCRRDIGALAIARTA
ncbi:MAG: phosphoribosylamine--glycine ligase [Alphaproteobacteria bacterium]|nr:phosphoribosylamine--glycine ligase [Alphaproteobacteria bacterium]